MFAKEVNSAGVAFHSYYMKEIASALKTALDKVVRVFIIQVKINWYNQPRFKINLYQLFSGSLTLLFLPD